MEKRTSTQRIQAAGVEFTFDDVPVTVRDGKQYIDMEVASRMELLAVAYLIGQGACRGDVFKYARRVLGLRAVDLAELLSVRAETISRWETGADPVNPTAFALLGAMVADQLAGRTDTVDRLRAIAAPRKLGKRVSLRVA